MYRRRIEYPGAFYHVIQRGNNRENIFRNAADKSRYLTGLVELKKKYDFRLFGYVLMDNHYHLLLQTMEGPLHKIMFRQNMLYSRYFNKTHNRSGHLYSDRYKASLIQDERYLFAVLRYIHWNPVKAGLCTNPSDYRWSSDSCYLRNRSGDVDIEYILNILSDDRKTAIIEYNRLMQVEDEINYDRFKLVGDEEFSESVKQQEEQENQSEQDIQSPKTLDDILRDTGVSEIDFALIKAGSRKRSLAPYKGVYVTEAIGQGYPYREIGVNIGISSAAVSKLKATKAIHCVLTC